MVCKCEKFLSGWIHLLGKRMQGLRCKEIQQRHICLTSFGLSAAESACTIRFIHRLLISSFVTGWKEKLYYAFCVCIKWFSVGESYSRYSVGLMANLSFQLDTRSKWELSA